MGTATAQEFNDISIAELMLIEQRVTNSRKSTGAAYALWFFVWFIGAHRWYLGRGGSAFAMGALVFGGIFTAGVTTVIAVLWAIVDMFLIPSWIRQDVNQQRDNQIQKLSAFKQAKSEAPAS